MCHPSRDSREQSCRSIMTIGKKSKTIGISQGKTIPPSITHLSYLDQSPEPLGVRRGQALTRKHPGFYLL